MEAVKRKITLPAPGARCEKCGSAELSSLPTFAVGCGVVYRNIADDVVCRRCGHMGEPAYQASDGAKSAGQGKQPNSK